MSLSAHWTDFLDIIALDPVLKIPGINTIGISATWDNSFYIIALQQVKKG